MPHDWIFDVLADLKIYAERNGLSATAAKAAEALIVARAEIHRGEQEGQPTTDRAGSRRRMN